MTSAQSETEEDEPIVARPAGPRGRPGVVMVLHAGEPACVVVPFGDQSVLRFGRGLLPHVDARIEEAKCSRVHVEISVEEDAFWVRDCESKTGTFVDGARIQGKVPFAGRRVVRICQSLLVPIADVARFDQGRRVELEHGYVIGPAMQLARAAVGAAARSARNVLVTGESGSGKERIGHWFHEMGPRAKKPFVEVNCANLQPTLAEAQLFGARKGAHSGATQNQIGSVQAAEGGTLFLDEVGELDLAVQAKLLRFAEQREIMPVGAPTPVKVDVAICAATNRDLHAEVAAGRFRQDLLARLGQKEVALPPLRDRLEEIPFLVRAKLAEIVERFPEDDRPAHRPMTAGLVEACMLREWRGTNMRGLDKALSDAVDAAEAEGATTLEAAHLAAERTLNAAPAASEVTTGDVRRRLLAMHERLKNVAAAAEAVGISRAHAYRVLRAEGRLGDASGKGPGHREENS